MNKYLQLPQLFLCLVPLSVSAATIPVNSQAGNDSRTISEAVASASPGDRIAISPGIYHETLTVSCAGTEAAPIVIESADPANPAIISGADAVTGWKPVAGSDLPEAKHAHADKLYYADADWVPTQLFVGAQQQRNARTPNTGWWMAESDGKTIISPSLAGVEADSLDGAEVFFVLRKTVRQDLARVGGWSKGGPLVMAPPMFKGEPVPYGNGDHFYLRNLVAFLDEPGEWVAQKTGSGARLIYWPPSKEDLSQVEAPRRESVIDLTKASHVTVRGLKICHGAESMNGFGIGANVSPDKAGGQRDGIVIEDCAIYQNARFGITLGSFSHSTVRRCLVADNSYGISLKKSRDITIEECEIAWNENDGLIVTWETENVTIRRNAIHHHSRWAHPDNFQTYRGVNSVTLDSNVLVASGQGVHTQETTNLVARNNIFAGPSANLFFTGKNDTTSGYKLDHNTFALFPGGGIVLEGEGHQFEGNIIDVRGGTNGYSGKKKPESFRSTNNLFCLADNGKCLLATFSDARDGKYKAFKDLEQLQTVAGLENGSVLEDPGYPSAPARVGRLDPDRMVECSASKLVLDARDGSGITAGDHVEFDFDGVDRIVKEVRDKTIVIEPPLKEAPLTSVTVLNWKSHPVSPIDLRSKSGRGSDLDFEAFLRGDFNGDGKRDIPAWPDGIENPRHQASKP